MLVVLHYGALAWAKYFPKMRQGVANQPANRLWRLVIPAVALAIILGVGYLVKSKLIAISPPAKDGADSTSTATPQSNSVSQSVTVRGTSVQGIQFKNEKPAPLRTKTTRTGHERL